MKTERLSPGTLSDRIQVWVVATIWCVLFGLLFTLGGCNLEEDPEVPVGPRTKTPVEENFTGEIRALPEPNKYEVHLKWAMNDSPTHWLIHRKEKDQKLESTQVAVVPGTENIVQDRTAEPGKEYTYFLGAVQDPHYTLKGKVQVSVPTDIELKGEIAVKGNLRANRLFLRDGAKVLTNGEPLAFEVNELLSPSGVIDTSPPPPASAAAGANGRSCGDVSIKANTASGRLTLQCKAENGMNGADGGNGRDGNPGAQGSPGDVEVKPNDQIPVQKDAAERAQLKHWYVTDTLPTRRVDKDGWKLWFYCSRPPADGATGEGGQNGADGMAGGEGGSIGSVLVEIKNDSDFQVRTVATPGEGSVGGRGGNGGKGGAGGPPGRPDPSGFLCANARHGSPGPDGLNGRPGRFGEKGALRPVCIRNGDRVIEGCH